MLLGEREYSLLYLFFIAAEEPLRVIPRVCNTGEQRQPRVEQSGSEKCAGGLWSIPVAVLLHINLRIA